jgi:RNA polymerase sigma-70 factor (ECF subfamily)
MDFSMLYQERAGINDLTDEPDDLAARARAGEQEAFGAIFEMHSRFIYKFIYAMLGDDGTAEELKQETFLAAYRSIGDLRDDAKLKTWLCGIAKNLVYKFLRSRRKEGTDSGAEIESLALADHKTIQPDREFLSKELNYTIRVALAELDDDKRLVFTLKELQHLSYKEISEITGAAIPKLKTDLRRAKIEMCRALRPYLEAKK